MQELNAVFLQEKPETETSLFCFLRDGEIFSLVSGGKGGMKIVTGR